MDVTPLVSDLRRNKRRFATIWYRFQESRFTHGRLRDAPGPGAPPRSSPIVPRGLLPRPVYSFVTTAQGITLQVLRPSIAGGAGAVEPRPNAVRVRVLAVSVQPLMRRGIMAVLQPEPDIEILGCCATAHEAFTMAAALHPDVLLLDPSMLGDTAAAIRATKQQCPGTRVLTLSDEAVSDGSRWPAGADQYLSKHIAPTELLDAIRTHHHGDGAAHPGVFLAGTAADGPALPPSSGPNGGLTPLETAVLRGVAAGLTDKEIAAKLFLSEGAVKTHLRQLYRRFRLQNREDAAAFAAERGLRHVPRPGLLDRG